MERVLSKDVENFSGKTARAVKQDFHAKVFMMSLCAVLAFPIEEKIKKEFFANLNILKPDELKIKNVVYSPESFHLLNKDSELTAKLKNKNLIDLKIPYNDILVIHNDDYSKELQIAFNCDNIFKSI